MAIGASLREFLLADSAIAAVVGTRVYPVMLPQKPVLPAVRYTTISSSRVVSSQRDLALAAPRIQVDVFASTFAAADNLAQLILRRLSAARGRFGSAPVQGAFFESERTGYEPESELYFVSRDYFVWFEDPLS